MTDYAPTTEEVRHIYGNYLDDNVLKWGEAMAGEARKRFDRWLAEHDRETRAEMIAQVRGLVAFFYPQDMTPRAKRAFERAMDDWEER